jgi:diguanylate cyclase (GGDEF)-like protein/PAS domain S-box-containing protein
MVRSLFREHYPVAYLLRALILAGLLPTILGFAIFVVVDYRNEKQRLIQDNIERAKALSHTIDNHILRTRALAQSLSGADEILVGDVNTFSKHAARAISAAGLGTHLLVYRLDADRITRYSATNGLFSLTQENTAAPREVLERGLSIVSDTSTDVASGATFVNAHVPVKIDGKTTYSIAIGIPTQQLTAILLEEGLPAGWLASLIDRKGIIAGRSRQSGKFIGQPVNANLLAAIKADNVGILITVTKDGVENLTVFSRSARTGYTTIIGVPVTEINAPLRKKLFLLIIIFVLLMFLGLILAEVVARLISNSVHALINPAVALGNGTPSAMDRVHLTEAYEVATAMKRAAQLLSKRDAVLLAQREELQLFYFFIEKANEVLLLLDREGNIRYANQMASRRLGYSNEELITTTMFQIDQKETSTTFTTMFERCRSTQVPPFECEYQCKDGSRFPVEVTTTVLEYLGEWLMHVAPRDISERVQAEQSLRWAASHDALTRLYNREFALKFLSQIFDRKNIAIESGAVLYIDLDRFKPVNDLYGHEIGDKALIEIANRMQSLIGRNDVLARVGGDEFIAILLNDDLDDKQLVSRVQALIDAVSSPINLGNIQVRLSASVGIGCFPEHGNDPDALIHSADLAMLQAKKNGRNTYVFYTCDLDERAQFVTNVEHRLRQALYHGHFVLHFQPIVDLASGTVNGVEALVRLMDGIAPQLGPADFIPIAEMCGLIAPLDQWVALEACRQQGIWRDAGIDLHVSVNVSALQFQRTNFIQQMRDLIETTAIDPRSLIIELTETAVMANLAEAARILNLIREMGIRVALDDFGTGYSSLSILSTLPIDKIKIDQSFIRRIDTNHASCAIIDSVIALAKSLQLELVAEGIETESAVGYLQERRCELGQGYYFSRPLTSTALVQWYNEWNGTTFRKTFQPQVEAVK